MGEENKASMLVKTIWVPSIVSIGTILNLLTIMVFCRRRMRKYCLSVSMVSLAIADTVVLLIPVLLTWVDEQFFQFYYLNNTIWCNLHGYVDLVSCANSSWIILLISTERWFAVCRPWQKNSTFTSRMVLRTIILIFLASLVLFAFFPFSLRLDLVNSECKIAHQQIYFIFGTISVILVYVLPFFILAILNVMIIIRLKQRPFGAKPSLIHGKSQSAYDESSSARPSEPPTSFLSVSSPNPAPAATFTNNHSSKNDRNLSITLVTLAITFMIFTFPFQAHWFYETVVSSNTSRSPVLNETGHPVEEEAADSQPITWGEVTFMIKNMNYLINFFLYSLLSKLFRQELLAMIGGGEKSRLNRCLKLTSRRRRCEDPSSSSFAELSFSVEAFKSLKKGQFKNTRRKLFFFKVEPANFIEYFRHVGRNSKLPASSVNRADEDKQLKPTENSDPVDEAPQSTAQEEPSGRQIPIILLRKSQTCDAISFEYEPTTRISIPINNQKPISHV